jgi:hypothetical protein
MISGEANQSSDLAAIEHHLERAEPRSRAGKAEQIERRSRSNGVSGTIRRQTEPGEQADGGVDVEHPAPVVILGQEAAQRGADDRAHHDPDAPHRHRRCVPLAWIGIEQHRLRQRHETRRRTRPAAGAKQHDLLQRLCARRRADAMVKPMTAVMNRRLRPQRAAQKAGRAACRWPRRRCRR